MDLSNAQGIWKDVNGRCLIRVVSVSAAIGSERGILVSDNFYAKIEVVKGSFRGASMGYESVMPKRTGVDLYVRGYYTEEGSPCGSNQERYRVAKIHASLSYTSSIDGAWAQPANRSRSG